MPVACFQRDDLSGCAARMEHPSKAEEAYPFTQTKTKSANGGFFVLERQTEGFEP